MKNVLFVSPEMGANGRSFSPISESQAKIWELKQGLLQVPLAAPWVVSSQSFGSWVSSRGLTFTIFSPAVAWVIFLMSSSSALRNWELPDAQWGEKAC